MGFFGFLFKSKVGAGARQAAATDARIAELQAASPYGTKVTADINKEPLPTTYTVMMPGGRRGLRALVDRMEAVIYSLQMNEEIDLRLGYRREPGGAFSSVLISGVNLNRAHMASLVRAHDSLAEILVDQALVIDGSLGNYTVAGVARHDAVRVARVLVSWWENMLESELERWPYSGISVELGGNPDSPGISYAVDLEGPEAGPEDEQPTQDRLRNYARLAVAGWTENLADLDAMTKVRVRRGYSVELGFTKPLFTPRVVVEDLDSGEEDKDEGAEILAAIRFHNPVTSSTA